MCTGLCILKNGLDAVLDREAPPPKDIGHSELSDIQYSINVWGSYTPFNDCFKKGCKIRDQSHGDLLMIGTTYDHNSGLNYSCKLRTSCILMNAQPFFASSLSTTYIRLKKSGPLMLIAA